MFEFERKKLLDEYGKKLWLMRTAPSHAAHWLAGVFLPPHERYWLSLVFSNYKENNVIGSRGTSKCLALGTKVRMFDYSLKKVEDVEVGDKLLGPDGLPRNVLDTTQGEGVLYRIHQREFQDYIVNKDHILHLVNKHNNTRVNVSVKQYIEMPGYWQDIHLGLQADTEYWVKELVGPIQVSEHGWGRYAGFTLDGDHLFLLEDGTITHNSFSLASLSFPLYDALHKNSTSLVVSASGFRGGKLLFEDIDRLFKGELRSQKPQAPYLLHTVDSSTSGKIVRRQPDIWTVRQKSLGTTLTVPTNKADSMRGIRANNAVVDERNTFDGEIVQKVIRPMLNVGSDFRKTAKGGERNKIFQVSTIDYTFRDWHVEVITQRALAEREYEAQQARKNKDWKLYEELMDADKGALRQASFSLTRFDYTDLIIPKNFTGLDGSQYEVKYPLPDDIEESDVLVWDPRDKVEYYYLYPVDKAQLEGPYLDGTADEDLWLAEQRNVFISASGNVYPHELIVRAADRPIYPGGKIPGLPAHEDDFYPPVLYECGDPCVIGMDYARESDELGIVVIRLGPLAKGDFDPSLTTMNAEGKTVLGKTPWSNVIWAESHKKLTATKAAEIIRNLMSRYNIVRDPLIGGGIGLDKFGGGTAVRDELAIPKPPIVNGAPDPTWSPDLIVYDPEDEDYKHFAALEDPKYWGGLELIHPTNQFNLEATMASKAMLQKQQLYLGYYEPPSKWAVHHGLLNAMGAVDTSNPMYYAILDGYQGINRLKAQLVRVQSKVTESSIIRFFVPGKKKDDEAGSTSVGRKDLYSAFIYACYMARHHLVGLTKDTGPAKAPDAQPLIVKIGSDHRPGRKDTRGWTKIGWRPR